MARDPYPAAASGDIDQRLSVPIELLTVRVAKSTRA